MPYKFIAPRRPLEFNETQILKALAKAPLYATTKVDGVRLHIIFDEDGVPYFRSRTNKPFPALKEIEAYHQQRPQVNLAGWTFEAEVRTVEASGKFKTCAETAGDLRRKDQLKQHQISLTFFDKHHQTKTAGLDHFHRVLFICVARPCPTGSWAQRQLLPPTLVFSMSDAMVLYKEARRAGHEGVVLTQKDVPYASGKCIGAGWKIKPEETLEATVTGLTEAVDGDLKHPKGMIGSLSVTYEDGSKGSVGAGALTFAERRIYWEKPELILGRLIEVSAMERNPTGGIRHGNFKMFRDSPEAKGEKI